MPLFFAISGYFFHVNLNMSWRDWIVVKVKKYFIPYCIVLLVDTIIVNNISVNSCLRAILGGRMLSGVYWYITCLFISELVFRLLIQKVDKKKNQLIVLVVMSILAITESNILYSLFPDRISWPIYLNLPFDLDVCLFTIPCLGFGYYLNPVISKLIENRGQMLKLTLISSVFIVILIISDCLLKPLIYTDLKYVQYSFTSIIPIIPFGIVLLAFSKFIKINEFFGNLLGFIGRSSLWIMYYHLPFKALIERYGIKISTLMYIILSIVMPCSLIYIIRAARNKIVK